MKRKIHILLTKFPDAGSKAIRALTGFDYTHASIGLEEDLNTFYSFVCKGFVVEKITGYVKHNREPFPCQLYELEVPEKVYVSIKNLLDIFVKNKKFLRYTRLGVVLCLLNIPYKKDYTYFCSQFVADVLNCGKAVTLKKDSALYLPGDLRKLPGMRLKFQGNMKSMIKRFSLAPCVRV